MTNLQQYDTTKTPSYFGDPLRDCNELSRIKLRQMSI